MFSRLLLHALTEMPLTPGGETITRYLPKSLDTDLSASTPLFYPLASDHLSQPAGMKLSFRPLPAYCIFYCTKGKGSITSDEKAYDMTAGSLLIFDCSYPFVFFAEWSFEYDIIYFSGNQSAFFFSNLLTSSEAASAFHFPSFGTTGLNSALRPVLPTGGLSRTLIPLAFNRYLTDFFTEAIEYNASANVRTEDSVPEYLRSAKEYIDNNFYKNITLTELESLFFVSRYRICRDFSNFFFVSPIQYLHQARIKKAKLLLTETSLKIHEIGYQVGYESTTLFINHFKKQTGRTPAAFRN